MQDLRRAWFNLKNAKHPLRFVLSRVLPMVSLAEKFSIERTNYKLRFHNSALSRKLFANPNFGLDDIRLIQNLLEAGDSVVDVGANVGDYTIATAMCVGENGQVYAFEPHPRIISYLRGNLALNQIRNVRTAQVAVGATFGWAGISDYRADSVNHLAESPKAIHVPCVQLDALIADSEVAVLKVDVEGAEKFVFDGALNLLNRTKFIVFEVQETQNRRFGVSFKDLHALLTKCGFTIFAWRDGKIEQVDVDASFPNFRNLVACRDRHVLEQRLIGRR